MLGGDGGIEKCMADVSKYIETVDYWFWEQKKYDCKQSHQIKTYHKHSCILYNDIM